MKEINLLNKDLDKWNVWRKNHPEIQPSLCGMKLRGMVFRGVNFMDVNFSNSDLRDTSFRKSNLSGANFNNTKIHRANFSGANLAGVNFKGAKLYETVFSDVDLSQAIDLDKCIHIGPSIIDHRTISRSGNLPISFLQGCGLPDEMIFDKNNKITQKYYSCFISYSTKDDEFVSRLYKDLQNKGVRCWYAPKDIKIGEKIRSTIDVGIKNREKLLLIISKSSIQSVWVEKEVETAFEEESNRDQVILFPIRLDDTVMEERFGWAADIKRSRNIGDFKNWKNNSEYLNSLDRLLKDLIIEN